MDAGDQDRIRDERLAIPKQAESKKQLLDQFRASARPVDDLIDILLSDELTTFYCGKIGSYEPAPRDFLSESRFARGCLLFLLMHRTATDQNELRRAAILNPIVRDEDFQLVFRTFYDIPAEIGLRALSFHASGTTSIIFKATTSQHRQCALKVIQAQYVRVPAIQKATSQYMETSGLHVLHSPEIFASSSRWILMSFVEGSNLNDYLVSLRKRFAFLSDEYVHEISGIFRMLTEALSYYEKQEPSIVHGDLTPFNIMVETGASGSRAIKLIDFGVNHVLQERLGSRRGFAEAFARTELFVAPEVVKGESKPSREADLYSLGMIGLDMMSATPLRSELVGGRLREIWQNPASVGLAEIIEDLIDENPKNRLLLFKPAPDETVHEGVGKAIERQFKLYDALREERKHHKPAGFFGSLFLGPKKAIHIVIEIARNRDRSYGSSSWWQTCGAVLNFICHFAIIFGSVYFTLLDASVYFSWTNIPSIGDALSFLGRIVQYYPNRIQVGDLLGNLPGRAVALTFGLIASRYYANIYSSIEVRDLETSFQKIANFLLRANSISYLPPILYAIVIDPHAWPACAFLGTLFPALNNWACWKVANAAIEKTRGRFSSETYHHSEERIFLNGYKEWSLMMFGYSIGIALIGGALYAGWAHDEWIYALLVCGINIAKIYRINCGTEAPRILGHLSRYFFYVRRLAAYRLRHPQPQTA